MDRAVLDYLLKHDSEWRYEWSEELKSHHFFNPSLLFDFCLTPEGSMFMSSLPEALEDVIEDFLDTLSNA